VIVTAKPVVAVSEMDMGATIHSEGNTDQSTDAELMPFIVLAIVILAILTGKGKMAFKGYLFLLKLEVDTIVL
jgi:hypothetical protein